MSEGTIFDGPDEEKPDLLWISSSGLDKYDWCQFQFYVVHILKYREPTNQHLFFGNVWDATLNFNYSEKVTSDKDLPKDTIKDFFRTEFDAKKEQIEDPEIKSSKDTIAMKDWGTNGVDVFYKEVIPSVRPRVTQPQLSMTFQDESFVLNGKPDLIEKAGFVIDNKTAAPNKVGGGKEETYIRQSWQPSIYSILDSMDQETGQMKKRPQEVRFDILTKHKKPQVFQPKIVITHEERLATLKQMMQTVQAIRSSLRDKNFRPTAYREKGSWKCSYCPVQTVCKKTHNFSWMPPSKVLAAKPEPPKKAEPVKAK